MTLADRLDGYPKRGGQGPKCTVRKVLESLDDVDRAGLQAALVDPEWTAFGLAHALHAEGFEINKSTLERHRRGDCACPRD